MNGEKKVIFFSRSFKELSVHVHNVGCSPFFCSCFFLVCQKQKWIHNIMGMTDILNCEICFFYMICRLWKDGQRASGLCFCCICCCCFPICSDVLILRRFNLISLKVFGILTSGCFSSAGRRPWSRRWWGQSCYCPFLPTGSGSLPGGESHRSLCCRLASVL